MTDRIGAVWEKGEEYIADGNFLDGLLEFQRAKKMLINESSALYSSPTADNKRIQQIFGEIMTKLTRSIDKNIAILSTQPLLTLKLEKGYNKKDVKKAYRQNALKYHPDKNPDCDSSSVFTIVQSAYEKLLAQAPDAPRSPSSRSGSRYDKKTEVTETIIRNSNVASVAEEYLRQARSYVEKQDTRKNRQTSTTDDTINTATAAATEKAYKLAGRGKTSNNSSYFKKEDSHQPPIHTSAPHTYAPRTYHTGSTNVTSLSSDELRIFLRDMGYSRVEGMNREELTKKYLAVCTKLRAGSKLSGDNLNSHTHLTENWKDKMQKEKERENVTKNKSTTNAFSSFSTNKTAEQIEEENHRADLADETRKKRVTMISSGLTKMKIIELQNLMLVSGLNIEGCLERNDLIDRLKEFYGIPISDMKHEDITDTSSPPLSHSTETNETNSTDTNPNKSNNQPVKLPNRISGDMDVMRLRQAMNISGIPKNTSPSIKIKQNTQQDTGRPSLHPIPRPSIGVQSAIMAQEKLKYSKPLTKEMLQGIYIMYLIVLSKVRYISELTK